MDGSAEIISRVERRRRWSAEQKVKILTEALQPEAVVAAIADRNGVSRSQIYAWMRLAREGRIPGISLNGVAKPTFARVRIEAVPPSPTPAMAMAAPMVQARRRGAVEVALTNGRIVRVEEEIEPTRLARLVAALDGARS